ncbi:MAG: zinc ribbon domain-containing protein [Chloroflexota bacterium]
MSDELINTIGTIAGIIVAGFGAFLFAFWISMGIWTFNDIRSRSRDWLAILLACLLVLIFPIIGLILYMMIRPKETLAEVYDRALEEEALLRELEGSSACHQCGTPIDEKWIFCPTCHGQLQHSCQSCKQLVRAEWEICVYCGTSQQRGQAFAHTEDPNPMPSSFGNDEQIEIASVQRRGTKSNPFMRPTRTME